MLRPHHSPAARVAVGGRAPAATSPIRAEIMALRLAVAEGHLGAASPLDGPPEEMRHTVAVTGLIAAIKAGYEEAVSATPPADKVAALQAAQANLAVLAETALANPRGRVNGLERAQAALQRLESTYRAFGFYRIAGVA